MTSTSAVMLCFPAKIEHFLEIGGYSANSRTGKIAVSKDKVESGDCEAVSRERRPE